MPYRLAGGVPRAVVLFCPLADRPERLLSEKEAGNVPSGWGMGGLAGKGRYKKRFGAAVVHFSSFHAQR